MAAVTRTMCSGDIREVGELTVKLGDGEAQGWEKGLGKTLGGTKQTVPA